MSYRRTSSPEHQDAVARRLELLSAELTTVREEAGIDLDTDLDTDTGTGTDDAFEVCSLDLLPADRVEPTRVRAPAPVTSGEPGFPETADPEAADPETADPETADPSQPRPPTALPVAGRHASRRPAARLVDRLVPATLHGRIALGAPQVAVLALLVAVALAATTWWVVRSDTGSVPVAPAARDVPPLTPVGATESAPEGRGSAGPTVAGRSTSGAPEELVVDVAGKVRRPGIVVLPPDSRVVDALEAAGGARKGVKLASLNLARPLVDGEQILVGTPAGTRAGPRGPGGGPAPASPGTPGSSAPLVSLNSADTTTLEQLPGVGPVTAAAIIEWRTRNGGFSRVDELLEVDGIGEATLAELLPHVTL